MCFQSYTSHQEDKIRECSNRYNKEADYSNLIDYINGDNLKVFGERLLYWFTKRDSSINKDNLKDYIKACCEKTGVDIDEDIGERKLLGWVLKKGKIKKSNDTKDTIFALAFALQLTEDETIDLFETVYLDRPFDYRRIEETVYYYCIQNKKTWQDVLRLIEQSKNEEIIENDYTIFTRQIKTDIENIEEESDLISYIKEHGRNYTKSNISALRERDKLLEEVKKITLEEFECSDKEWFKNDTIGSNNFVYKMITGLDVSGENGTITWTKNSRLPEDIKRRFPEAHILGKKAATYEELRKLIILLFSYRFWYKQKKINETNLYYDYIAELNLCLFSSGMSDLYPTNPYDWLFLCCAKSNNPLDMFRGIIADVAPEEMFDKVKVTDV